METCILKIVSKPTDYKVCNECQQINWYENEVCKNMSCDCRSFNESSERVQQWITEEYTFYMEEEFMEEEEVDDILVDI